MDDPGTVCDDKLTMNKWITIQFFGAMFTVFACGLGFAYIKILDYESRITVLETKSQYGKLTPPKPIKKPEGNNEL